jgi:hypothetical protein
MQTLVPFPRSSHRAIEQDPAGATHRIGTPTHSDAFDSNRQTSEAVQGSPSSQGVPSLFHVATQLPFEQTEAEAQAEIDGSTEQTIGVPAHSPEVELQTSSSVQGSPSSHVDIFSTKE